MPLNVNDDDLDPSMTKLPEPKTGCTQMTFGLIRFEITSTMRKLQYSPPGPRRCNKFFSELSIDRKEKWVRECHENLENKYLKDTDMSVPLYWVSSSALKDCARINDPMLQVIATVSRLIMSKMWLMIYHPFQRLDGGSSLPQEVKDRLFITSLDNVEYSILLETEEKTKRWGWLFRTYVQWHAIAFMLSELCERNKGLEVERAWKAIDFIVGRRWADDHQPDTQSNKLKGHLWKPLKRLMERARTSRKIGLAEEKEQQAREIRSTFDPQTDIINLDFGVDRLFPDRQMKENDGNNWGMDSNTFTLANGINTTTATVIMPDETVSSLQTVNPLATTNMASTPGLTSLDMSVDWGLSNSNSDFSNPSFSENSPSGASPLLPDGNVNWANWDDLVTQFGMDLDQNPQGNPGQPWPYGSTFGGLTQWY